MPEKIQKTDTEWKALLAEKGAESMAFEVTRHAATERPYTGKYDKNRADGTYQCICCGAELFDSSTKFDAGCGWPSYWEPIDSEVVERVIDKSHGTVRVEVRCNRCGSHLGHVFDDGPDPTGERFCINSAAIDFKPETE